MAFRHALPRMSICDAGCVYALVSFDADDAYAAELSIGSGLEGYHASLQYNTLPRAFSSWLKVVREQIEAHSSGLYRWHCPTCLLCGGWRKQTTNRAQRHHHLMSNHTPMERSVIELGARADGISDDGEVFQRALDQGPGTVHVAACK